MSESPPSTAIVSAAKPTRKVFRPAGAVRSANRIPDEILKDEELKRFVWAL